MKDFQSSVSSGLSTDTYQVSVAGAYYLSAQSTVNIPSGLVITLSQSGSKNMSIVSPPCSPLELFVGVQYSFFCQVGDILSVVVTSSALEDQPPNLIKTTIVLRNGP